MHPTPGKLTFTDDSGRPAQLVAAAMRLARIFYRCERPAQIAMAVIGLSVIVRFAFPPNFGSRSGMPPCLRNCRQINVALGLYNRDYGCLPPAVTFDANGRAMHSWRVLLAPYVRDLWNQDADWLEAFERSSAGWSWRERRAPTARRKAAQLSQFLAAYDYSQPWDSPTNRKLAAFHVEAFSCPDRHSTGSANTDYVAVTGPETAWPADRLIHEADIRDSTMCTLLLVEIRDSNIPWTEPRDLPFADLALANEGVGPNRIGGPYRDSSNVCCADGSVRPLWSSTPPDVLKALFTINGHDGPHDDDW